MYVTHALVFTNLLSSLVILQGPESIKALLKCYINKMNEYTCMYMYMCTINVHVVTLYTNCLYTFTCVFQISDPIQYHCLVYNIGMGNILIIVIIMIKISCDNHTV